MKMNKPKFWDYKRTSYLSLILFPFTIFLYLLNFFKTYKAKKIKKIKILCLGNIYLGGTGKTPLAIEFFTLLKKLKYKPIFIKKYYKDQKDEQNLLKKYGKLLCKEKRIDAIKKAVVMKKNVAILDDGLQDNNINHDLSFVCFNIDNWVGNGNLLPAGPLRENIKSLIKYDSVFLTGNGENAFHIKKNIKKINSKIKIFEAFYKASNIKKINKKNKYLVFSGIGNPKSFVKTISLNKIKISETLIYPDHYNYTNKDIKEIKNTAKKLNAKIITTEKDYLRLNKLQSKNINFLKVKLVIQNKPKLIKFLKHKL